MARAIRAGAFFDTRTYGCQKMHPYIWAVKTSLTYRPYVQVVLIDLYIFRMPDFGVMRVCFHFVSVG